MVLIRTHLAILFLSLLWVMLLESFLKPYLKVILTPSVGGDIAYVTSLPPIPSHKFILLKKKLQS